MHFFVNGEEINITLENEKTVGEVLQSFEETCAQHNATTITIVLNGKTVSADEFDAAAATPLSADTKLELTIVSEEDIAASFAFEARMSREIAEKLEQIPVHLQSGKDREAHIIISQLADLVDNFCHTASLAALFPHTFGALSVEGKSISTFFADFSGILNDFRQALEDKDTVLIGDLAEYEISPRLRVLADAVEQKGAA